MPTCVVYLKTAWSDEFYASAGFPLCRWDL